MRDRKRVPKVNPSDSLIVHCREVLGQHGEKLSDHEIDELRRNAELMARVLIEMFQSRSAQAERP